MRILIVKLGALGDVINSLPLAVNLKRELDATIDWVSEPLSAPLLQEHPAVERVIIFPKKLDAVPATIRQIRQVRYDMVLDLQRIWKSGIFSLAARARRRIGFDKQRCKEQTWLLPFERIAPGDRYDHMLHQYRDFATHLGINNFEVRWDLPASNRQNDPYIVLNIGATKAANRWTTEGFSRLAGLIHEGLGLKCILSGGPEDVAMAAEISAPGLQNMVGRTSLLELKELLAGAAAIVSCDTGPMHLGVALKRPVVALFGPANPRRTGPYRGYVIQHELECIPCGKRHCAEPRCMLEITADEVLEQLKIALA